MMACHKSGLTALVGRGIPHVMVANIAQQALAFLGVLVITRLLPPDEFAMVRIAMAYMAVATILGTAGLTAPILRYCADAALDTEVRRYMLGVGLKRVVWASSLTLAVALLLVALSGRGRTESLVLAAYALQIPALAAGSLLLVYFQAIQQFRFLAYSQVAIRLLSFLLTVVATWSLGLWGVLMSAFVAALLGCLPLIKVAQPLWGYHEHGLPPDFTRLARYSLLGMLISTLGQYADLILLDRVGAMRTQVAVYSLATIFFFAVSALAGAVQSVATPMFTGLMSEPVTFRARWWAWTKGLSLAGCLVSLGVVALAWGLEHRLLGRHYEGLTLLVAVLMLRFCLWCTYAIGGAALVGIGAIRSGIGIATATTLLTLAAGYPLCKVWGVWGAAWTQVLIALVSTMLIWHQILREMRRLQAKTAWPPVEEKGGHEPA